MDADQHVDLDPPRERSGDEQRATAALSDLADAPGLEGAGGPGALATVRRRAVRRRRRGRRRVVVATALVAVVVAAGVVVVPTVLPGPSVTTAGPGPRTSGAPRMASGDGGVPGDRASSALLLTRSQVEAVVPDARSDDGSPVVRAGVASAEGGTVGGWCGDAPLAATSTAQETWSASWTQPPSEAGDRRPRARLDETVLSWGATVDAFGAARTYVESTDSTPLSCSGGPRGAGPKTFELVSWVPAGVPFAAQAAAPLEPPSSPPGPADLQGPASPRLSSWLVRAVAPVPAGGAVVDLTVVLTAEGPEQAVAAVGPLMAQALVRASSGLPARPDPFPLEQGADPSPLPPVPGRQPGEYPTLGVDQVRALWPDARTAAAPQRSDPSVPLLPGVGLCGALSPDAPEPSAGWEVSVDGGPDRGVDEAVLRWEGPAEVQAFLDARRVASADCEVGAPPTYTSSLDDQADRGLRPALVPVIPPGSLDPRSTVGLSPPSDGSTRWQVDAALPASDDRTVATVVISLPASSAQDALRAATPLLEAAAGAAAGS